MTKSVLDEMEAALREAVPTPWTAVQADDGLSDEDREIHGDGRGWDLEAPAYEGCVTPRSVFTVDSGDYAALGENEARLICLAVNHLPALLRVARAAEALRSRCWKMEGGISYCRFCGRDNEDAPPERHNAGCPVEPVSAALSALRPSGEGGE